MRLFSIFLCSFFVVFPCGQVIEVSAWGRHYVSNDKTKKEVSKAPASDDKKSGNGLTGIREVIPSDARQRYQSWKNELLSTEFGRNRPS
ncbi:MAG: hypothetical protein ABI481_09500 [Pyrinomonadaceae bacterium]